jgi:hypothetical protein
MSRAKTGKYFIYACSYKLFDSLSQYLISNEMGRKKVYMKKEKEYPEIFMLLRVNKYSPFQFLTCFGDNITFRITWFLDLLIW